MNHKTYDTLLSQLNRELQKGSKDKTRIKTIIEESQCPYLKTAITSFQR